MHKEPSKSPRRCPAWQSTTHIPLTRNHAVDEDTDDGRCHDKALEPEELLQLIRPEKTEEEMDQPKQEEGQHAFCRDPDGLADMVGDIVVAVSKDGSEDVAHVP